MEDMMDNFLTVEDENGNELQLAVQTFFDFKDEQYAVLCNVTPLNELADDATDEQIEKAYDGLEFFIQKVVVGENDELDFADPEEFSDELVNAAQEALEAAADECDDDDCEECGCGCHHHDD